MVPWLLYGTGRRSLRAIRQGKQSLWQSERHSYRRLYQQQLPDSKWKEALLPILSGDAYSESHTEYTGMIPR